MTPDAAKTPGIDAVLECAKQLPTLPQIVTKVLSTLKDENSATDQLVAHLNTDAAIVARLLAAANSSAFGFGQRVDSTRQAILVLGLERVRTIILATAILDRFSVEAAGFDVRRLWLHSLGVAVCAEVVADALGIGSEGAFTAGLLHDVGQLLLVIAAPEAYARVLYRIENQDACVIDAERAVFGFDHALVGSELARRWRLPLDIADAIEGHHEPDLSGGGEIADIVHVAEVLSHALDLGEFAHNRVPELSVRATASLGITWSDFSARFGEIEARFYCLRLALSL